MFVPNSAKTENRTGMNEATITYRDKNTLEVLEALGKRLGFDVAAYREDVEDIEYENGMPVTKRDTSITIEDLKGAFTGMGLDARKIRETAWQRKR